MSKLYFLDAKASFADNSQGAASRRLIDRWGRAHLDVNTWKVGLDAYRWLVANESVDEQEVDPNEFLQLIAENSASFLEDFWETWKELAGHPNFSFVDESGHPLSAPISELWCEASWGWRLNTACRLMSMVSDQMPDGEHVITGTASLFAIAALSSLDDAIVHSLESDAEHISGKVLEAAQLMNSIQSRAREHAARTSRARGMAIKRHSLDPKQKAKAFVKECWRDWVARPKNYASDAAFARAMLDKWPDDLTSEVVVCRWVRDWRRSETGTEPAE